ncbi:MAG: transporter, partial [Chthonomonadaceae bacterium]|nr:transporter [Chthonomonadaceae bacterium]
MALLEVLPDFVENTLREIRAREPEASDLLTPSPDELTALPEPLPDLTHAVVATLPDAPEAKNGSEPTEEKPRVTEDEAPKLIAFATDINTAGTFGPEWVVVENGKVFVFGPNGGTTAKVLHAVPLNTIKEAKAEVLVGNGLLEVRTDTETIPLVRFSQAAVGEANSIARQINALSKGEPAKKEKLDEKKLCPRCQRRLPDDTEVCPACVNKRAVMLRLFQFLAPYKAQAIGSVVVILLASLTDLAPPFLSGRIVDTLINSRNVGPDAAFRTLLGLIGALIGSRLLAACCTYTQRRLNSWLGARVLMDIRIRLYDKFNFLSMAYYDKRSTGSVMARITNDSDQLWDFLSDGIPWFVNNTFSLILISGVLFRYNWQLALLLLVPVPFIYGLTSWFFPRAHKKWRHVWTRISRMYSALNSSLNGMRVIKAFAQEERENGRFRHRNEQVFEASYAANAMWAVYWAVIGLLMAMGSWTIYLFGGHQILNHVPVAGHIMTVGALTAFIGYLGQFYAPFQNFSRVLDWSTRSMTAAERVFEVLDTEPDVAEKKDPIALPEIKGAVEFKDVAFTYDKAKRVLDDFTLKVEPGEMIGLVGHSGAGKSTIINLLSRFYDVTEGDILVDGIDIRDIKTSDFRRQFGIVLQEPFLFPGTIRDNIAYAKPEATTEEVVRAAKAANCHNFLLKFPDGYDTQVGERGQRLSGGERQRISIARAILHDPKILILDEATASVDTETEKQIQEAISNLIKNRTTFAIAHRLSTLRNASRLVVMKEGKMVECGTHDELMDLDGEYAKLVN